MKRTTRSSVASGAVRAYALQQQRNEAKQKATLLANENAAKRDGLKSAACLCCGNRGSVNCVTCDA